MRYGMKKDIPVNFSLRQGKYRDILDKIKQLLEEAYGPSLRRDSE